MIESTLGPFSPKVDTWARWPSWKLISLLIGSARLIRKLCHSCPKTPSQVYLLMQHSSPFKKYRPGILSPNLNRTKWSPPLFLLLKKTHLGALCLEYMEGRSLYCATDKIKDYNHTVIASESRASCAATHVFLLNSGGGKKWREMMEVKFCSCAMGMSALKTVLA